MAIDIDEKGETKPPLLHNSNVMASSSRPRRQCAPDERALQNVYALENYSEDEENISDQESDCDELQNDVEEGRDDSEEDGETGDFEKFQLDEHVYLLELAKTLMHPLVMKRSEDRNLTSFVKNSIQRLGVEIPSTDVQVEACGDTVTRGRCHMCSKRNQVKVQCQACNKFVCKQHSIRRPLCDACNQVS